MDRNGNKTDYDIVTLDEGEKFLQLKDKELCYRLSDTRLEERYDAIGEKPRGRG